MKFGQGSARSLERASIAKLLHICARTSIVIDREVNPRTMLDGVDAIARFAMSTFGIFQGTTVTYARVHAIIYRHEGVEVLRCKCEGVMKSASVIVYLCLPVQSSHRVCTDSAVTRKQVLVLL